MKPANEESIRAILIRETCNEILFNETEITKFDSAASLRDAYLFDSVSFMELRSICETVFKIEIDDEDMTPEHFRSIDSLSKYVAGRLNSPALTRPVAE